MHNKTYTFRVFAQFASTLIVFPFCFGALAVFSYYFVFKGLRAYRIGLILLLINYITIAQ